MKYLLFNLTYFSIQETLAGISYPFAKAKITTALYLCPWVVASVNFKYLACTTLVEVGKILYHLLFLSIYFLNSTVTLSCLLVQFVIYCILLLYGSFNTSPFH